MNLRDLQVSLDKRKTTENIIISQRSIDVDVACKIVGHLFRNIDICLKEDKSKVKLSLFAKSFIRGILNKSVENGINDFLINMNDKELKTLLDDMQKELDRRTYRY